MGYLGPARLGEGYNIVIIRELDSNAIERFVFTWSYATQIAIVGEDTPATRVQADREANSLLEAIRGNEQVQELTRR